MLNVMVYSAVIVSTDDADSSEGLLGLSSINKLNQIMVSKNLFFYVTNSVIFMYLKWLQFADLVLNLILGL